MEHTARTYASPATPEFDKLETGGTRNFVQCMHEVLCALQMEQACFRANKTRHISVGLAGH